MNQQSKLAAITLLALLEGTCVIMVGVASAQSITKPSVPNFTVTYVDNSYYMEPVYGVDQYSGETIQTGGGYTVQNKSFELKIKTCPLLRTLLKTLMAQTVRLESAMKYDTKGTTVRTGKSTSFPGIPLRGIRLCSVV